MCVLLLVAKKFDRGCLFVSWPKDVVLMLARDLFETRGDQAWLVAK